MFDIIIVGQGPAGFTAGIYAGRRKMKTLIIGDKLGGQLAMASEIENYPGFKSIQGFELILKMKEQVENIGIEIKNEEVKQIFKKEEYFEIITEKNKYNTKTIILAIGLAPRRLAIQGEERLVGKGVSYCANCDAPLYKDKTVAVVGGGNSALDAAELLSKIAKKVYLIHRRQEFKAFEALIDEVKSKNNIEMVLNSVVDEIIGEKKVEKIKIKNIVNKEEKIIDIDGIFIEIGRIAHTDIIADLVKLDEKKQIIVDEKCQTNVEGIFAAGDVTQVPFKQITIACGQGTIAALAAYQYLQMKQGKTANVTDRSFPKKQA